MSSYRGILRGISLGTTALTLIFAANAAMAQEAPETVTVTGTLLNSNFVAPTPVTAVGSATIDQAAETGIGTVIAQLPFVEAGGGLTQNTGGVQTIGQSFVNLRGLTVNRTLVLIDGQRPTPETLQNNFDTDLIPSSLVQRFEVVTTGASASYGSDAVAGVVNIIMKDHFEGFSADVRYGISQRGDSDQPYLSVAYGTDFLGGRGHFEIGAEGAANFDPAYSLARPWGALEPGLVATASTRPANLAAQVFSNNVEYSFPPGGIITSGALKGIAFNAAGTPYNFQYGSIVGSNFMIGTGNYGNSDQNRALAPPYAREALLARVDYNITQDISAFFTINGGSLDSDAHSTGEPVPVALTINSGNPFIPASVQQAMTADGLSSISLQKQYFIPGGHIADNQDTLLQSLFGVKGTIFGDWAWNLEGNYGRGVREEAFTHIEDDANAYEATYAVTGSNGQPVCGPVATNPTINGQPADVKAHLIATLSPNCVPINPFGNTPLTSAQYNYLFNPTDASGNYVGLDGAKSNFRQLMFQGSVSGSPVTLPAGELDVTAGGDWRTNSASQVGTEGAVGSYYDANNPNTFFLRESVYEMFAEAGAPVVKNLPFIEAVNLNAAVRYTDYSISGAVTTWKYGATWDIDDSWRLRATKSVDIRAPNFSDINPTQTTGASTITNPLSLFSARIANIETVGNPDLKPEVAHNLSAGVVFTSNYDWLPGFKGSADYYRINITGVIATVAVQDVINRCLLQSLQQYCTQIDFSGTNINTTLGITTVKLQPLNLNQEVMDGWDLNMNEDFPLQDWGLPGALNFSALGSYVNEQRIIQTLTGGGVSNVNYADTTTAPRWSVNANLLYSLDNWSAALRMIYYDNIEYSATNVGPGQPGYAPTNALSINRNIWPDAMTFNLQLTYNILNSDDQRLQAYFNVDNLFDKDPPMIWGYVSNYDVMGRYFKVGMRYNTN